MGSELESGTGQYLEHGYGVATYGKQDGIEEFGWNVIGVSLVVLGAGIGLVLWGRIRRGLRK